MTAIDYKKAWNVSGCGWSMGGKSRSVSLLASDYTSKKLVIDCRLRLTETGGRRQTYSPKNEVLTAG